VIHQQSIIKFLLPENLYSIMKEDSSKKKTESSKNVSDVMVDKATDTFQWWNKLATLNKEDSIGLTILKIGVRIIGILVLIAISPLALVGLIIAFLAVI